MKFLKQRTSSGEDMTDKSECSVCPNLLTLNYYNFNFSHAIKIILHEEILRFEQLVLDMNERQNEKLEELVALMDDIIKSVFPNSKVRYI
jgi:hypothetical protein